LDRFIWPPFLDEAKAIRWKSSLNKRVIPQNYQPDLSIGIINLVGLLFLAAISFLMANVLNHLSS